MAFAEPRTGSRRLIAGSQAQAVLLLRWVLIIATSYLVVFSRPLDQNPASAALFVAAYFASNIVLSEALPRFRSQYALDASIVLLDIVMVSVGLALTAGTSSEFYVVYFLVIFLSALTERLGLVVGAAFLISAAHLYTESRIVGSGPLLTSAYMLRVPFLLVVAMFFGRLVQDAREREHQAEEARARERRMAVLSAISHDLKNPLGVVQSLATLLLDGDAGPLSAEQAGLVRRIHATSRHVITFAMNMIDAARIDAGRLVLQSSPVQVGDLVEDALLLARSASDLKGVALRSSVEPSPPTIRVDAVQMERVIDNLLGNAIKFTPAGGTVELSMRCSDDQVILAVRDDGPGIAPSELPGVFEQYSQRAARAVGSGLGLFIVKAIVEAHDGSVAICSALGQGTTVTVRLPIVRAEPLASHVPSPTRRRRWPFGLAARVGSAPSRG